MAEHKLPGAQTVAWFELPMSQGVPRRKAVLEHASVLNRAGKYCEIDVPFPLLQMRALSPNQEWVELRSELR